MLFVFRENRLTARWVAVVPNRDNLSPISGTVMRRRLRSPVFFASATSALSVKGMPYRWREAVVLLLFGEGSCDGCEIANAMALLRDAICHLAARCDGSRTNAGKGFSAIHRRLGRELASRPEETWTPEEKRKAWKILETYKRQLADAGIPYENVPEPPGQAPSRLTPRRVEVHDGRFVFVFDYDHDIVNAVKELPRRSFDAATKLWSIPIVSRSIPTVVAFVERYNFDVSDAAKQLLQTAGETEAQPDKLLRVVDDMFVLGFDYDAQIVRLLKRIPGAKFVRDPEPLWRVPVTAASADMVLRLAADFTFIVEDEVKEAAERITADVETNVDASRAHTSEFEVAGLGGTLRPFQRAAVAYAVKMNRLFLADEMGLGKTIQALAALEAAAAYPALVICPATVKLNWLRETGIWLPHRAAAVFESLPLKHDVTIINYEQLGKLVTRNDSPKRGVARKLNAIVCDESHYIKNGKAKRTVRAKALGQNVDLRLCLTGTPVLNRPQELISQLEFLDRLEDFGGFWGFAKRYCNPKKHDFGWDFSGSANLDELNTRLRGSCYIRRLKADVLTELPPKQRSIVTIDIDNRAEYNRAETNLIQWLRENAANDEAFLESIGHLPPKKIRAQIQKRANSVAERARRAEELVRIEKLKQLTAKGKMAAVKQWVETFLESGEKLVLFAHHQTIVGGLAEAFSAQSISGSTPNARRQEAVDSFQNDLSANLIVCNIKAGGVGITLTAASNVCFVELEWTPAAHDQAEDRCHRISQQSSVNAWYLLGERTIDTEIYELIDAKRAVVDAATEGKASAASAPVLRELKERLKRTR